MQSGRGTNSDLDRPVAGGAAKCGGPRTASPGKASAPQPDFCMDTISQHVGAGDGVIQVEYDTYTCIMGNVGNSQKYLGNTILQARCQTKYIDF